MLKSDLIAILVSKRQLMQKQAEQTVDAIFDSMKGALCKGDNIEIRGLGAFHVKHYQGYNGRNPKTGQIIPVKPKRGILEILIDLVLEHGGGVSREVESLEVESRCRESKISTLDSRLSTHGEVLRGLYTMPLRSFLRARFLAASAFFLRFTDGFS